MDINNSPTQSFIQSGEFRSSWLESYRYDPLQLILEVTYYDGSIYTYFNVASTTVAQMLASYSQGAYYRDYISRNYAFEEGGGVLPDEDTTQSEPSNDNDFN